MRFHSLSLVFSLLFLGCAHHRDVWIDTDASVGVKDRDVDDGVALVQALHSPELAIRGVSAVFGNAELSDTYPITKSFVPDFSVAKGAARAGESDTEAARVLAEALRERPLTILALGPLTNVAAVLKLHPELKERIREIVAVAGRRPGQRFTTGTRNTKAHRDFNFESDAEAARVVVASGVPLTLTPFEISSQVWITESDVAKFPARLVEPARAWLKLWKDVFSVDGFNPFDTLAVAYLTSPDLLTCEKMPVMIEQHPDDVTEARMQGTKAGTKPYLLVVRESQRPRVANYCYRVDPRFKADLLNRLRE